MTLKYLLIIATIGFSSITSAQDTSSLKAESKPKSELKYALSADGSKYIKATFLSQVWLRHNQSNPGTTVNNERQSNTLDLGLRRVRFQLYGQLTDRVFFYTQFGMNNFNFISQNAGNRKLQAFFHDAVGEVSLFKKSNKLKIGGGLTIASGLSRFTQPGVSTIMTLDVPVFLQSTVDQTDEFARKLSIYARGQIGKLDYRVMLSDPFTIQNNGQPTPVLGNDAVFSSYGHTHQYAGLFIWNFLDKEPHTTPYMAGTYLGDKKVLNLEAGAIYQDKATWHLNGTDTNFNKLLHLGIAAFADMPVLKNKYALSAYAGFFSTDYGPRYIRNNGLMNPANGNSDPNAFNGAGNAYPMFGTGNSIYTQLGFRFQNNLLGDLGTLMPYLSYRHSNYDKLDDPVAVTNIGVNWLMNKQLSKLTLNYQQRPVFEKQASGAITHTSNAGELWMQYQVFF